MVSSGHCLESAAVPGTRGPFCASASGWSQLVRALPPAPFPFCTAGRCQLSLFTAPQALSLTVAAPPSGPKCVRKASVPVWRVWI